MLGSASKRRGLADCVSTGHLAPAYAKYCAKGDVEVCSIFVIRVGNDYALAIDTEDANLPAPVATSTLPSACFCLNTKVYIHIYIHIYVYIYIHIYSEVKIAFIIARKEIM